jgi:DNA-binding transcriptional ArsR family regulator
MRKMPRLSGAPTAKQTIEFVVSEPLDLMNSMYFTHLARDLEGIEGWPKETRTEMEPELLRELDFLYRFPLGQPGVMGAFGDRLFAYPETWRDVDSLVRFVRELPAGTDAGIQALVLASVEMAVGVDFDAEVDAREALKSVLAEEGREPAPVLAILERPAELRERMARLIERFYEEHYRGDLPRRLPCMERSVAANREVRETDIAALMRRLTGRPQEACEEEIRAGAFERLIFVPSLDMGPYNTCGVAGSVHGLFYSCEAQSIQEGPEEEETRRLARLHKALGDDQRLRILYLLRDGELYAQEIVERTGLHQSVVSRHLTFMKAVGLVSERRQNNMKFFSINPSIREELGKTLDLFNPRGSETDGV